MDENKEKLSPEAAKLKLQYLGREYREKILENTLNGQGDKNTELAMQMGPEIYEAMFAMFADPEEKKKFEAYLLKKIDEKAQQRNQQITENMLYRELEGDNEQS